MRRSLFPEQSSSDGETESDSDEETNVKKIGAPKPIVFHCAPKLAIEKKHSNNSSVGDLYVLDRNEKEKGIDATSGNIIVNKKKEMRTNNKESKNINANCVIAMQQQQKSAKLIEPFVDALQNKAIKELLAKSIVRPGFEKTLDEGCKRLSKRALWRQRKAERERTKGTDWFNLPATEMTEERERDLQIIQMRDALDTKTHYKRNDRSVLPKYFQVGTIVENKADFYSSRIPKKQRKRTIVEELMADEEFQTRQKKKYDEIKAMEAIKKRGTFQHSTYRRRRKNKLKSS